jgi:hypothetical protein
MIRLNQLLSTFAFSAFIALVTPQGSTGQAGNELLLSDKTAFGISVSHSPASFKAWGKMQNTRQTFLKLSLIHSSLNILPAPVQFGSELIITGHIKFPNDGANGPRESILGLGLIPMRLNVPFSSGENWTFLTSSAGFLVTESAFPDSRGTRFNYMIELGLGYNISISNNRSLQMGYKLHHFSNGNTGMENPGIDSHMLFINLMFWD